MKMGKLWKIVSRNNNYWLSKTWLELLENKATVSHNIPYFVVAKLLQCN